MDSAPGTSPHLSLSGHLTGRQRSCKSRFGGAQSLVLLPLSSITPYLKEKPFAYALYFVYTEVVFQWDPRKAAHNLSKHGVSFTEATSVFADTHALDGPDLLHSLEELRFLRIGKSNHDRLLMVAYTMRRKDDAKSIRIISARKASRKERAAYAQGSEDS